jgi:photosystem II stability/assembly factor-like uncharacterized protein
MNSARLVRPSRRAAAAVAILAAATAILGSLFGGSAEPSGIALGAKVLTPSVEADAAGAEAMEPFVAAGERAMRATAPFQETAPGAYAAAVAAAKKKPKVGAAWQAVGSSPLWANNHDYDGTDPVVFVGPARLGWVKLSGRITSLANDPARPGRLFAAPAAGGVYESTDNGTSWRSIADNLPTQAMGSVAYSAANGGTIIAATGDNAVGGVITPSGLGVYTSTNDGKSWTKAAGVPDGLVAFKAVVDPSHPATNYVATNKGLFRSTDDGQTYANVNLPVPGCAGDTTSARCEYATVVTDVAVKAGDASGLNGGAVIAAVGWPLGRYTLPNGIVEAPQNGIYTSPNGSPGTFQFQDPTDSVPTNNGFAPTPYVGRTTLAIANGAGQNHNVVYALVQDAEKLQGCVDVADLPAICTGNGTVAAGAGLAQATYLDGLYMSSDFGVHWTKVMTPEQLRAPGTGSALELGILGYGPGIQSWYNNWIAVDPTATDPVTGLPTRIVFGLEEVWENSLRAPVTAPTQWKVIGRYWNACLLLVAGTQCSSAAAPIPGTTLHPDQHAGLFVPDGKGGVTLYAGNDGGAYKQHVDATGDFSTDNWGDGINDGLHTLQPYDAEVAKDGTVVAGLQDNGTIKIAPDGRQDMTFGGDGFFVAVDPDNSNRQVEEYAYGAISGTLDGGRDWTAYDPQLTSPLFATPFQLDPTNADHLLIGAREVDETQFPYRAHCAPDPSITTACGYELPAPGQGSYDNWMTVFELGQVPGTTKNRVTSATDLRGDYAYVGYCGSCSAFGPRGFESGIATNVGGGAAPKFGTSDGWHIAAANGLPERYVTSVRIDPTDPTGRTIYVTLGGYSSHWVPPGAIGEDVSGVGAGHVFVSHDAGENFTDVSGDIPDVPADWVLQRAGKLIVGTDIGVFISTDLNGGAYSRLGDLPAVPVVTIRQDPGNGNRIVAATFGRGVYSYTFN